MTSDLHAKLLVHTRAALQEILEPDTLLAEFSEGFHLSDTKVGRELHRVADSCAPELRRKELYRLCDELEAILDANVTGWLRSAVQQELNTLVIALSAVQRFCTDYSDHVEPYEGLQGYFRMIAEFVRSPLEVPRTLIGTTDYQQTRLTVTRSLGSAIAEFRDACLGFILALEQAFSKHTGSLFRFRNTEQGR